MDYKKLNEKLKSLNEIRYGSIVSRQVISNVDPDHPSQGKEGEEVEVYDIGLPDGMFLMLTINTDSYGDNERVSGIQFVKAKEKKVLVYEP